MFGFCRRMHQSIPTRSLVILFLLTITTFVGCSLKRRHEARKIPQFGVIDSNQPSESHLALTTPYVIQPPDELELEVEPSTITVSSRTVKVQPDGTVDLGLGGDVSVAGLTLPQAELHIANHLVIQEQRRKARSRENDSDRNRTRDDQAIQVSLRVTQPPESRVYYVIGTVDSEGSVAYQGGETVLKAILEAGLRSNSLPDKAYLVRPQPKNIPSKILRIDWTGITERGDQTTNYQLFPGDRIVVPGTSDPGLLGTLFGG